MVGDPEIGQFPINGKKNGVLGKNSACAPAKFDISAGGARLDIPHYRKLYVHLAV
jgi:hypothetical protein